MSDGHHPKPESVLIFLQGADAGAHPGIIDGYMRLKASGKISQLNVLPIFGPNGVERGEVFWREALEQALEHKTTLVVFQYYHSLRLPDPRKAIHALKRLPSRPLVVSTLGDAFMNRWLGGPEVPRSFLQAAQVSDLATLTSMGKMADFIAKHASAPILLSPNAVCQVRFQPPNENELNSEPEFDVVFIGSRNTSRNPLRPYAWLGKRRERLVDELTKRFGKRFAVFGNGWDGKPANQGPVPFDSQARTARRGRVIVGGVPFSQARYYTSNRPFIQITSGIPMVDSIVPGVESLLRPDEHWILAEESRLVDAVERTLELGDERRTRMGRAAAKYVLENHTQAHRVATLLENVRRLRAMREKGVPQAPYLPFFLPEIDTARELSKAVRNWPLPQHLIEVAS